MPLRLGTSLSWKKQEDGVSVSGHVHVLLSWSSKWVIWYMVNFERCHQGIRSLALSRAAMVPRIHNKRFIMLVREGSIPPANKRFIMLAWEGSIPPGKEHYFAWKHDPLVRRLILPIKNWCRQHYLLDIYGTTMIDKPKTLWSVVETQGDGGHQHVRYTWASVITKLQVIPNLDRELGFEWADNFAPKWWYFYHSMSN